MAYLTWIVRILLFLVLLGLAVRNLDVVQVHGYLGYVWQAPLAVVMLAALVLGVAVGVAGALRTALFLTSRRPPPTATMPPELPQAPAVTSHGTTPVLRTTRDLPDDQGA